MQLNGIDFSAEEIEEIELLKELCEGMTVDGVEIVCFKVLSDLLNNRVRFEDIPKEGLQTTQLQMNDMFISGRMSIGLTVGWLRVWL